MVKEGLNTSSDLRTIAGSENIFSVADILAIIRKRWKFGALVGLTFAGLLVLALLSREKVYQAQSSLTVELSTANVMDIREVLETNVTHVNLLNTMMNTHLERIQTRAIAEAVVASLSEEQIELLVDPYFDQEDPEATRPDPASIIMKRMLQAERGGEEESQVIHILITHANPRVAQVVANAYLEAYIDYKAGLRSLSTSEAVDFLGKQVETMRERLNAREEKLQDYRQEQNLVSVQQDQGIIGERLRRLNDAVTDARIRLLNTETRQKQIEAAGTDIESLMEVPFIGAREDINQIYAQLNELKRERKVLDETYLSKHPKILENEASLQSVSEDLKRALTQARQQAKSEYEAIQTELATLRQNLKEAEQEVLDAERAMVEYKRMERELEKEREMFDKISTRYSETSIAQQMDLNNVRVLEVATLPGSPQSMSNVQVAAAAFFVGAVFFFGVPLVIEMVDGRLSSFRDIEGGLGKPVLGDIRFFPKKNEAQLYRAFLKKDSDLIESFRSIFSSIRMRSHLSARQTAMVVTSSIPHEGKSVVTSNLACAIAKHGCRVLIVDCDLRRPAQHGAFGLENDKGLLPWFESGGQVTEGTDPMSVESLGIREIEESIFLLRSGGNSEEPTEVLGDRRTGRLFDHLKSHFDVIVYDTPPVGLFPDATLVADYADSTVFVASQFKVKRSKLRYSVGVMERSNAPVLGVVFNLIKDVNAAVGYGQTASASHYGAGYEKNPAKYRAYYSRA